MAILTDTWAYEAARDWEALSPDRRRRLIVREERGIPQVYLLSLMDAALRPLIPLEGVSYDPAWSPHGDRIAFVSQAPGNDEIFVMNVDGSGLHRLTVNERAWDRHPSWSPDGTRIVFYSNRDTGRRQIWVMNADGSDQRNLSNNEYEEWDPVWLK